MKLVWIIIDGYRRFDSRQTLHVDCRTVALLGPNEAGKTSVLRALLSLNQPTPFSVKGASQDLTRDKEYDLNRPIITARFLLEEEDYEQLSDVPEVKLARWLWVEKLASGALDYRFDPPIKKDIKPRLRLLQKIRPILSEFYQVPEVDAVTEEDAKKVQTANDSLLLRLQDAMPDENIAALSADSIKALKALNSDLKAGVSALSELIEFEQRRPPAEAASRLSGRVPEFVLFSGPDRDLRPAYDLNVFFGPQPQRTAVPDALKNLAAAADLSLEEVFAASQAETKAE